MKKVFPALVFLTVCAFLSAHDFSSSCSGGKIYLDIKGAENKIIRGSEAFVKGEEFYLSADSSAATLYSKKGSEGPLYDDEKETIYYKRKFAHNLTLNQYTVSCSINAKLYMDNCAPNISVQNVSSGTLSRNGTFYSSSPVSFEIRVEKDLCDSGKSGAGLALVTYTVDSKVTPVIVEDETWSRRFTVDFDGRDYVSSCITVRAEDMLGNFRNYAVHVVLDKTPPVLKVLNPPEPSAFYKSYELECEASDAHSMINESSWSVSENGVNFLPADRKNSRITLDTEGEKNVVFKVQDLCSNSALSEKVKVNIDCTPPSLGLKDAGLYESWLNVQSVTAEFFAEDDFSGPDISSVSYSSDGGKTYVPFETGNWKICVRDEGVTSVRIRASDCAGNEAVSDDFLIKIDRTEPELKVSGIEEGGIYSLALIDVSAEDSLSGTDASTGEYTLDGGKSWKKLSLENSHEEIKVTADGNHVFKARIKDLSGNLSETESLSFMIDSVVPECRIVTDLSSWICTNEGFTVKARASDSGSGTDESMWKAFVDGKEYPCHEGEVYLDSTLESGSHSLYFTGKTRSGISFASETSDFHVDNSKASVRNEIDFSDDALILKLSASSLYSPLKGAWYKTDGGSSIYLFNDSGSTETEKSFSIEFNDYLSHEVSVYVQNMAGTVSETSFHIPERKNEITVFITALNDGWCRENTIEAFASGKTDPFSWRCLVQKDGVPYIQKNGRSVNLDESGIYEVRFYVTGEDGTEAESPVKTVYIDNLPPENLTFTQNRNVISFSASDNYGSSEDLVFECREAGFNWQKARKLVLSDGLSKRVFLRVTDRCGNVSTADFTVNADITPPVLDFKCDGIIKQNTVTLRDFVLYDGTSSVEEVTCIFNGQILNAEIRPSKLPVNLTLGLGDAGGSCPDGTYDLTFYAVDSFGNKSQERKVSLVKDSRKPDFFDVSLFLEGRELHDFDYIDAEPASLSYSPSMVFRSKKEKRGLEYYVHVKEGSKSLAETVTEIKVLLNKEIPLNSLNFAEGKNELILTCVNEFGNETELLNLHLVKDSTVPSKPVITSPDVCDIQSERMAFGVKNVRFDAVCTSQESTALKNLRWQLFTSRNGIMNLVRDGETASGDFSLYFQDLPDNLKNEFYILKACFISEGRRKGPDSEFRFRIDNEKPADFSFTFDEIKDRNTWYGGSSVTARWNIPEDMTGIEKYSVQVLENKTALWKKDFSGYDKSAEIPLRFNGRDSASLTVRVTAFDFCGNSSVYSRPVHCDFKAPVFTDLNADILDDGSLLLSCGGLVEKESGILYIRYEAREAGADGKTTVIQSQSDACFKNLNAESFYLISASVFDKAGNSFVLSRTFDFTGTSKPVLAVFPYSLNAGCVEFSALKEMNTESMSYSMKRGRLIINGSSIDLKDSDPADENTEALLSSETGGEVQLYGFKVSYESLVFSTGGKIIFRNARLVNGGKSVSGMCFSTLTADLEKSVIHSSHEKFSGETAADLYGFAYEGIGELWIEDSVVYFSGEKIRISSNKIDFSESAFSTELSHDESISESYCVPVTGGLKLKLASSEVEVLQGFIRNNLFYAGKCVLRLPDNYYAGGNKNNHDFVFGNFTVNALDGTVSCLSDFYASELECEGSDGLIHRIDSIRLDGDGVLRCSSGISLGVYGISVSAQSLALTEKGIDFSLNAQIENTGISLFGFDVFIEKAEINSEGLFIEKGRADVYSNYVSVDGLGLSIEKKDLVIKEWESDCQFTDSMFYRNTICFNGIKVSSEGFVAAKAGFTLPDNRNVLEVENVILYPNHQGKAESEHVSLKLYGYDFIASHLSFDGERIHLKDITACSENHELTVSIRELSFNGCEILECSGFENLALVNIEGWNFELFDGTVTPAGLCAGARLIQETDEDRIELFLEKLTFTSSGIVSFEYAENKGSDISEITFNGYRIQPEAVSFTRKNKQLVLNVTRGNAVFGSESVMLGKTVFSREVEMLSSEKSRDIPSFCAEGQLFMLSDASWFENGELKVSGGIYVKNLETTVTMENIVSTVHCDGTVSTPLSEEEFDYTTDGWNVHGKGIIISYSCPSVLENIFTFNGTTLDAGRVDFDTEGKVLRENEKTLEQDTVIFSEGTKVNSISFTSNGLKAVTELKLPPPFEQDVEEGFRLTLNSDGTVSLDYIIPELECGNGETYKADLKGILIQNSRILIGSADIEFPLINNLKLHFDNISMDSKGRIDFSNFRIQPFVLWGMIFDINAMVCENGDWKFKGSVVLPPSIGGSIAGMKVKISSFVISSDGRLKELLIKADKTCTIPLFSDWSLGIKGITVSWENETPLIKFTDTYINFPQKFGKTRLSVSGISFNLENGSFDFTDISLNSDFIFNWYGISFTFNSFKYEKDKSFTFAGNAVFEGSNMPAFLRNARLSVNAFEILRDGSFGEIDVEFSSLDGKLTDSLECINIEQTRARLIHDEDGLSVEVGGCLVFNEAAPSFVRGIRMEMDSFLFKVNGKSFSNIHGRVQSTEDIHYNFCTLRNAVFDFTWNGERGGTSVSFELILPPFISGSDQENGIAVDRFFINESGKVEGFSASAFLRDASFRGLSIIESALTVSYNDDFRFEYSASARLGESFPEGIRGLTGSLVLKAGSSSLESAEGRFVLDERPLFSSLMTGDAALVVSARDNEILFGFEGGLYLSGNIPSSLKGLELRVNEFTLGSDGNLYAFDAGISSLNMELFDFVALREGELSVHAGNSGNEVLIRGRGCIELSGALIPDGLRNTALNIEELEISTVDSIRKFTASLQKKVRFEPLKGVIVDVKKLSLDTSGISLSASVNLDFEDVTFADASFNVKKLKMNYEGHITEFNGGIEEASVNVAGFGGRIRKLYAKYTDRWILACSECVLVLPSGCGDLDGNELGLKNCSFDPQTGKFSGEFMISDIRARIAGFTLECLGPSVDFSGKAISFSAVNLCLPDFLGSGKLSLINVHIGAAGGFNIGGMEFTLPDFKIGEVGFQNIRASFSKDEEGFLISGSGCVSIPGAGLIDASLSFTDVCSDYPIGVKHAYFSYESYTTGIPLGTTGLCLCGIRGGFAFGYPDEVPAAYRKLFGEKGTRIQLGLTVKDQESFGKLAKIKADCWVDVTKLAWVFEGDVTLLSGTLDISARAAAVMSSDAFATGLDVKILFIHGKIQVYIFEKDGSVKFSGQGSAAFRIPKGILADNAFITVPSSDIWLLEIGTKFGDFTNNKRGFLGYVSIDIGPFNLGKIGAFIGSRGIDLNVSNYRILKPDSIDLDRLSASVASMRLNRLSRKLNDMSSFRQEEFNSTVECRSLSRLVFIQGYASSAAEIAYRSPSGKIFSEVNGNVQIMRQDNMIFYGIDSPEDGSWTVICDETDKSAYALEAFLIGRLPQAYFTDDENVTVQSPEKISVRGKTDIPGCKVAVCAVDVSSGRSHELLKTESSADCTFAFEHNVDSLPDGNYYLTVSCLDEEGIPFEETVSRTQYQVDRSMLSMLPPVQLKMFYTAENTLILTWKPSQAGRTEGYRIYRKNLKDLTGTDFYAGNITRLTFNHIEEDVEYSVSARDRYGNESERAKFIPESGDGERINIPSVNIEREVTVECAVHKEIPFNVDIKNFLETEKNSGWLYCYVTENPSEENIPEVSVKSEIKVSSENIESALFVYADEHCAGKSYSLNLCIHNEAFPEEAAVYPFTLKVVDCPVEISAVYPSVLNDENYSEIRIYGEGFTGGTRFFIDDIELCADEGKCSSYVQNALIPHHVFNSLENGMHVLTAVSSGGRDSVNVEVRKPDYALVCPVTEAACTKGSTVQFPVSLLCVNGFDSSVEFLPPVQDEGLEIMLPVLAPSREGIIAVTVPSSSEKTMFIVDLKTKEGKKLQCRIMVRDEDSGCKVHSISTEAACRNSMVRIYGTGFTSETLLYCDGKKLPLSRRTPAWLEFEVKKSLSTGKHELTVIHKKEPVGEFIFTVLENSFTIETETDSVTVKDEPSFLCYKVKGRGKNLKAVLDYDKNLIHAEGLLPKVSCGDEGTIKITRVTQEAFETALSIRLWSDGVYAEKTVSVVSTGKISFITSGLPDAFIQCNYRVKLETDSPAAFSVKEGSLPEGLYLSPEGIISGMPLYEQESSFTVNAEDSEGNTCSESFSIRTRCDSWFNASRNGNFSIQSEIPAVKNLQWDYQAGESVGKILCADEGVVLITDSGITVLDYSGKKLWSKNMKVMESLFTHGTVFALTQENILHAFDCHTGRQIFMRENVSSFVSDSNVLYSIEERGAVRIDTDRLQVLSVSPLYGRENLFLFSGRLCFFDDHRIYDAMTGEVLAASSGKIKSVTCDPVTAAVTCSEFVVLYDQSFNVQTVIFTAGTARRIAVTAESVYVQSSGSISGYSRTSFASTGSVSCGEGFVHGIEKFASYSDRGLKVLSQFTGNIIWEDESPVNAACAFNGKLFTAGSNTVMCWSGTANLKAPDIEQKLNIPEPDGNGGWFRTIPELSLEVSDAETYAENVRFRQDGGEWTDYQGIIRLHNGRNSLSVRSLDSRGLRAEKVFEDVRIDIKPPVTDVIVQTGNNPDNQEGWLNCKTSVSFVSSDEDSGTDATFITDQDSGVTFRYSAPVVLDKEGISLLKYYSRDVAGNMEDEKEVCIKLDFTPPEIEADFTQKGELTFLNLTAFDSLSGVKKILVSINGNEAVEYRNPMLLLRSGVNEIRFCAQDNGENTSRWKTVYRRILYSESSRLMTEINAGGRETASLQGFATGLKLYADDCPFDAAVDFVPPYLSGAEYIPLQTESEVESLNFYVTEDCTLYMCGEDSLTTDESWTYEGNEYINRNLSDGNCTVHSMEVKAGDYVFIDFTGCEMPLILAVKK